MPLAFAPFGFYFLVFPILALLLWLWLGQPSRAFFRGWLFGLGQFGVGVHWIYFSLHDFGGAAPPFAILSTFALVVYLALFPALAAWLVARNCSGGTALTTLAAFPALWTLSEWLREHLLTGFPWLALGYSQIDSPLSGWAPLGGVMVMHFVTALCAGALLELVVGTGRTRQGAAMLGIAVLLVGSAASRWSWSQPDGEPITVAAVQGNIAQDLKWSAEWRDKTLQRYLELTVSAPPVGLVVWPETALPAYIDQLENFTERLVEVMAARGGQLLTGAPTRDAASGAFYNSLVLLGPIGGVYHKVHLVPFGEYLPLRWVFEFFETYVRIPMADFSSGHPDQSLLSVAGVPASVSICYEVIFGDQMRSAARRARLLINVSNDAWFGDSLAPHQHLEMARMRALENGRQMIRATNNGISAILDADGEVLSKTAQFQATVLSGSVQPHVGATPFSRIGYWPVSIFSLLLAVGVALSNLRHRRGRD
jgi:apolipoprotein N-acyltransferase